MKKKYILLVLAVLVLLVPVPLHFKDGGTITYRALLYSVTKMHAMTGPPVQSTDGYYIGTAVSILFFKVYDDVVLVPEA